MIDIVSLPRPLTLQRVVEKKACHWLHSTTRCRIITTRCRLHGTSTTAFHTCWHLYGRTAVLKVTRCRIASQWTGQASCALICWLLWQDEFSVLCWQILSEKITNCKMTRIFWNERTSVIRRLTYSQLRRLIADNRKYYPMGIRVPD